MKHDLKMPPDMIQLLSFIKKEFYHILRDKRTILILLVMPVIQIILFGFAITTEIKNNKIVILDPSRDIATSRIVRQLVESEYFELAGYLKSDKDIEKVFINHEAELVIVFADKFSENLMHTGKADIQIIADASDPNTAVSLFNYASGVISYYQQELMNENNVPYQITSGIRLLYNPGMKGAYNFVPGVMGMILMLICAMMTSIAIVREKETGTMEVLLVSPMRPILIIISKAVPYFILSSVNLTTTLMLSVFVLGVPVAGSLFWLVLFSVVFIFVSLSLGLLVSTITRTQVAAMLISGMTLMMPVLMLSGMMFPIENMPKFLQWLSHIIPARWYIAGVRKLMIKGLGVTSVLKEFAILGGMAVILITVSLKKFKKRLE